MIKYVFSNSSYIGAYFDIFNFLFLFVLFFIHLLGILAVIGLIAFLRFYPSVVRLIFAKKIEKIGHLYDLLVVLDNQEDALIQNVKHEDIAFFRRTIIEGDKQTLEWMMNGTSDMLEKRFEVQVRLSFICLFFYFAFIHLFFVMLFSVSLFCVVVFFCFILRQYFSILFFVSIFKRTIRIEIILLS